MRQRGANGRGNVVPWLHTYFTHCYSADHRRSGRTVNSTDGTVQFSRCFCCWRNSNVLHGPHRIASSRNSWNSRTYGWRLFRFVSDQNQRHSCMYLWQTGVSENSVLFLFLIVQLHLSSLSLAANVDSMRAVYTVRSSLQPVVATIATVAATAAWCIDSVYCYVTVRLRLTLRAAIQVFFTTYFNCYDAKGSSTATNRPKLFLLLLGLLAMIIVILCLKVDSHYFGSRDGEKQL